MMEFRVRRKKDVDISIHTALDAERCKAALLAGEAIVIAGHLGFVMRLRMGAVSSDVFADVTLRHTGPQLCDCKEEPRFSDVEDEYR